MQGWFKMALIKSTGSSDILGLPVMIGDGKKDPLIRNCYCMNKFGPCRGVASHTSLACAADLPCRSQFMRSIYYRNFLEEVGSLFLDLFSLHPASIHRHRFTDISTEPGSHG